MIAVLHDRTLFSVETGASWNCEWLTISTGFHDTPGHYTLQYPRSDRGIVKEALLQAIESLERSERIEAEVDKHGLDADTYWRSLRKVKQETKAGCGAQPEAGAAPATPPKVP